MSDGYLSIDMLIELLRAQEPDRTDLLEDLKRYSNKTWLKRAYIPLVSSDRPNKSGSDWQFDENIVLEHDEEGTIVLDVLKGGRVGGIEMVNYIGND